MAQRDFGTKPFPNQLGNGTPDFVFPVADPFRYAGNNVIDASADFANVPDSQLPSVGIIAYGGPGNDTIIGSQASDFLAGGSGNNTIWGERGNNQIYGNDGINVNVITRALTFPTENASSYPNADPLIAGANLLYGDSPTSIDRPVLTQVTGLVVNQTGGTLTRTDGGSWTDAGFVVGQTQVTVDGVVVGDVAAVTPSVLTLTNLTSAFALINPSQPHTFSVLFSAADSGNYDDAIIGNLGAITQNTAEATVGSAVGANGGYVRPVGALERIQTTGGIETIATTDPGNAANVRFYGGPGRNVIIGGSGSDAITVGGATVDTNPNVVVGDNGLVVFAIPGGWIPALASIQTTFPANYGNNTITAGYGNDVLIGGSGVGHDHRRRWQQLRARGRRDADVLRRRADRRSRAPTPASRAIRPTAGTTPSPPAPETTRSSAGSETTRSTPATATTSCSATTPRSTTTTAATGLLPTR